MSGLVRRYALDADVLMYSINPAEPLGDPIRRLLSRASPGELWGSTLLLPELLSKPLREGQSTEVGLLVGTLASLDLVDIGETLA